MFILYKDDTREKLSSLWLVFVFFVLSSINLCPFLVVGCLSLCLTHLAIKLADSYFTSSSFGSIHLCFRFDELIAHF